MRHLEIMYLTTVVDQGIQHGNFGGNFVVFVRNVLLGIRQIKKFRGNNLVTKLIAPSGLVPEYMARTFDI